MNQTSNYAVRLSFSLSKSMLNKLINYESRERHVTSKKNAPNKLQVAEDESEAEKLVAKLDKLVFREAAIVI